MSWRVVLAGVLALGACRRAAPSPAPAPRARVHCESVSTRSWPETRMLRGVVAAQPDRDAIVSAQVAGRLVRVLVREGDAVRAGAVLAEVEPSPLRDALRQAEAVLAQARAQREAAASAATREQHLFERGINARQSYEAARAILEQAEGSVSLANAQVDVARRNVERATVRAPLAGVVIRLLRREGEVVDGSPATPIMEVADPHALELAATVSANDLVALREGQTATVTFEAIPATTFSAHVLRVAPAVDAATGVGAVRLTLESSGRRLPMGILGSAEIAVAPPRPVLVVPAAAVRSAGGSRSEVVICDGHRARPRAVTTGDRHEGLVAIASGLDRSIRTRVVVDGLTGLEEGSELEETR